MLFVEM